MRWLLRLVILGAVLLAAAVAVPWLMPSFGAKIDGERLAQAARSANHRDGTFQNLTPTRMMLPGSMPRTLWAQLAGNEQRVPPSAAAVISPREPKLTALTPDDLRVTWLGHSTTLIELGGRRVLTDPIWSERCSPFGFVGPKRFFAPPIPLEKLPPIDAVVISHDHYDHLDEATVRALAARGTVFFVPLAVDAHLARWGVPNAQIHALDWWEKKALGPLTITATPARHFSGRLPWRENETLWASWVIAAGERKVYFSGDTGYSASFAEIGRRLGPFALTIFKIGAYGETWPDIHVTPEQAVQAHQDLGGKVLLPVHWATFNLAMHRWDEPGDRVLAAARGAGVTAAVLRPGESVNPMLPLLPAAPVPWWRGAGSPPAAH